MVDAVHKFQKTMFMNSSELTKAYRKVSLIAHPNKGGGEESFKKLNTIYTEGLVWFMKSSSEFLFTARDDDMTQVVKGTSAVPAPKFMKDDFPVRWARQLVTACEVMYEYHKVEYDDFHVHALQFIINSVCRLRAYYEAWLQVGASPKVEFSHFAQSWQSIQYLSSRIFEMRGNIFNPISEELTAAFAHVEYSTVDVSEIKITGEAQWEKMFGDEVWAKVKSTPKNKTFTEQELEQFVHAATTKVAAEAAVLSLISSQQAAALTKMETQTQELNEATEKAKNDLKLEISKSLNKIKLMEKQLLEQLDQVYGQYNNQVSKDVSYAIGFPADVTTETMEREKTIIRRAYDFFDSININDDGDFSVNDAMHAAFMMQYPAMSKEGIEKKVDNGVRNTRRQIANKKRTAEGTEKKVVSNGYHSYPVVARLLLNCPQLTEFCDLIISLATLELTPCPIRTAMRVMYLKDISNGNLNVNVAYNILGLCNAVDRELYLLSLHAFTNEKIMCAQVVRGKGVSQKRCSHRAMKGKEMCSYHMRQLKFHGRTQQVHVEGIMKSIYCIRVMNSDMAKVGYTSNVRCRMSAIQVCCPLELHLEFAVLVDNAHMREKEIHCHLKQQRKHIRGEWFRLPLQLDTVSLLRECGLQQPE